MSREATVQIALVADLHGNWPATEAVDADIARRGIKTVYCLGDLVGKGPSSARTFDWALAQCDVILAGNWDLGVLARDGKKAIEYANVLGEARLDALKRLPMEYHFWMSGLHIRLIHGRPLIKDLFLPMEKGAELRDLPLFRANSVSYAVVGYADIHMPAMRLLHQTGTLFNTGSVGNSIGDTCAHYAILSGEPGARPAPFDITFVALEYDRDRAIADAQNDPDAPDPDAYIREIQTGVYSR